MSGSKKEIFAFIDSRRDKYPLKLMCDVYAVSTRGYHSWKERGLSQHTLKDKEILNGIETIFYGVKGIYGSPKIHAILKSQGVCVGKNRVARLMRENSLKARCARLHRSHAKMDRFYASIRNKIHDIDATAPDQVWVGDVTYLRANDEWRYLAVIMDKFSRRIVGWSLSEKRNSDLSLNAFKHAAKKRLVTSGLYFHSDRGAEYVAFKYRNWLKDNGVIQSMNRKGVMNDNAEMESFFYSFIQSRAYS